jgi:hypothetical protein
MEGEAPAPALSPDAGHVVGDVAETRFFEFVAWNLICRTTLGQRGRHARMPL